MFKLVNNQLRCQNVRLMRILPNVHGVNVADALLYRYFPFVAGLGTHRIEFCGVNLWNRLPRDITAIPEFLLFKKRVRSYFIANEINMYSL